MRLFFSLHFLVMSVGSRHLPGARLCLRYRSSLHLGDSICALTIGLGTLVQISWIHGGHRISTERTTYHQYWQFRNKLEAFFTRKLFVLDNFFVGIGSLARGRKSASNQQ